MIVINKQFVFGVLTPILDGNYFGNIIKSIAATAKEYDIKIVVIGTTAHYYNHLYASDYVDGWIVIMDAVDDNYIAELKLLDKPVIGINTNLHCDDYIRVNNEEVLLEVGEHMKEHGHKNFAYVGDVVFHEATERFHAIEKMVALQERQPKKWFYNSYEHTLEEIVKELVEQDIPHDTIFCVNDFIAYNLVRLLKHYHIYVPNDVAVIGFDNSPTAKSFSPPLTTIELPIREIGEQAIFKLLNRVSNQSLFKEKARLEATPVYRISCGCSFDLNLDRNDEASETIEFLSQMVARNFNLGQLMQSYDYQTIIDMTWLVHSPFRKIIVGLKNDEATTGKLEVHRYHFTDHSTKPERIQIPHSKETEFPSKYTLLDNHFMGEENVLILIPIIQDNKELGIFSFVGLADITSLLTPLNTTYQLVNFFAAALRRAKLNEDLRNYSNQLEIISDIMYDGIWELDLQSNSIVSKGGINQLLGYPDKNLVSAFSKFLEKIHPKEKDLFIRKFQDHLQRPVPFEIECRIKHKKGHYIWMYITGQNRTSGYGVPMKMVGSIMDISERKKAESRINELAYHDSLTQLANRLNLEENLTPILKAAKANNKKVAFLLFDLDRFKVINDTYGHQAGDRLLQIIAKRLKSIAKENYLICRLGGDEFVIVIPNLIDMVLVEEFSIDLLNTINAPIKDQELVYTISTSIGVSVFPDHCLDAETLMLQADIAMYNAKTSGRNRVQLYNQSINQYNYRQVHLENQLNKALEKKEFYLLFQPIYNANTMKIIGFEALIRWKSEELGEVMPNDFIPVAEENGTIIAIGEWVLREACYFLKDLDPSMKIFVNISSKQLNHMLFLEKVEQILNESNCVADRLCFELTETAMLEDLEHSKKALYKLNKLGIHLSLDDFGTGYSSLSILNDLPIQILKIDKSFIQQMESGQKNKAIVEAIVQLSHKLSIEVVAEGVENKKQLDILLDMKLDYLQGYYFKKPSLINTFSVYKRNAFK
ncbi:EAL domain-containing protein [Saliterribacillus persicus]|uniref:PAS domain S-box-containing protein/diguanylate cyclase (GGDEF)-like protein n=1 Tax=Saliterribacillus persicus TaxID=930114 RepID=A0A368X940_9BACI|nr:EAL domain-containing protein [Saliterribacillus persicus]RCW63736.1 PAS domain S-box-containing protein/diguanylate cyclase (GGDEF)-like protein [Saliterribacillus persicus]